MILGIMQPYFVPYIGYWQLMNAVDKFVIYDDVNYINRGWINRNRILFNGEVRYFNIPVLKASQNKLINEIAVNNEEKLHNRNLMILKEAYRKAPYFEEVYPVMENIINSRRNSLACYIEESFYYICDYLNIKTELIVSSNLKKDNCLRGQDKILSICELLGAESYYNPIGGQALYSFGDFQKRGINLKFVKMNEIVYKQFGNIFFENLSIIDVMMFNSFEKIREMLEDYQLV